MRCHGGVSQRTPCVGGRVIRESAPDMTWTPASAETCTPLPRATRNVPVSPHKRHGRAVPLRSSRTSAAVAALREMVTASNLVQAANKTVLELRAKACCTCSAFIGCASIIRGQPSRSASAYVSARASRLLGGHTEVVINGPPEGCASLRRGSQLPEPVVHPTRLWRSGSWSPPGRDRMASRWAPRHQRAHYSAARPTSATTEHGSPGGGCWCSLPPSLPAISLLIRHAPADSLTLLISRAHTWSPPE
ncbi:hypothetical protein SHXM_01990 [Streptomyces hygroscopicus]|nr:hypothetical protein SHXM_01990 [Streptomyces hygroscopicus]